MNSPWKALFPPPAAANRAATFRFWLVRKRGKPFLLLPVAKHDVGAALNLYPAQTVKARFARAMLGACVRLGFAPRTESVAVRSDSAAPFVKFLFSGEAAVTRRFAMLLGSPNAPGRRFILLIFDSTGRPEKLVKAGIGRQAVALIQAESEFLKTVPVSVSCAPRIQSEFRGENLAAIAFEFARGRSPSRAPGETLARLLTSWVSMDRQTKVTELPVWQRLRQACVEPELLSHLEMEFREAAFHPAIFHGDFAPWNIRVDPTTNDWRVLDWERGELSGPPAWDWFHYVIQPLLLVRRLPASSIAERIEAFIASPDFSTYAAAANVETITRPLLLAYLLYCRDVLKPAEGLAETSALLRLLLDRWRGHLARLI